MGIYKSWIIMPSLTFEGKRNDIWVLNACYYFHFFHIASNENVGRCKCRTAPISRSALRWLICMYRCMCARMLKVIEGYTPSSGMLARLFCHCSRVVTAHGEYRVYLTGHSVQRMAVVGLLWLHDRLGSASTGSTSNSSALSA